MDTMKYLILITLFLPFTVSADTKDLPNDLIEPSDQKVLEQRAIIKAAEQRQAEKKAAAINAAKQRLDEQKTAEQKDAEAKADEIKAAEQKALVDSVEELKRKASDLEDKYEHLVTVNEQTMSSISNQLSAASYYLGIFGFLFALGAILLGVYITFVERKVMNLTGRSRVLFEQSKTVKKDVEHINTLIQSDIKGLYDKIKREETVYLLNTLLEVPYDIGNLSTQLLSRKLERDDFYILKNAYLKLKEKPKLEAGTFMASQEDSYKLVFFQHFLNLAVKDEEIGPDMTEFYPQGIECSFDNDIMKSSSDFIKGIYELGFKLKSEDINSYYIGLSGSPFKDNMGIYQIFFDTLSSRVNRFEFYELLSKKNNCTVGRTNFGKLLVEEYSETELSESEQAKINEINVLLNPSS